MFNIRWKITLILIVVAGLSYWLLGKLIGGDDQTLTKLAHYPDYYMENFNFFGFFQLLFVHCLETPFVGLVDICAYLLN